MGCNAIVQKKVFMKKFYLHTNIRARHFIFISCIIFSLLINSTLFGQTVLTFTNSGSWVCPAGVSSVKVECWGAGAAGGGVASTYGAGGGGGGGAYAINVIPVTVGTAYNYTVGTGGIALPGANGGAGGSSWFGSAANILAAGGSGGSASTVAGVNGTAGAGGTIAASIGSTLFSGGNAAAGTGSGTATSFGGGAGGSAGIAANGNNALGAAGGTAVGGGGAGANGSITAAAGNSAISLGGGGAGAKTGSAGASRPGGAGFPGQVKITYTQLTYKSQFVSVNVGIGNWCAGETRNVTIQLQNTGTATWTNSSPDINIGVKWNTNTGDWTDYHIRVDANNLIAGATGTYVIPVTASNNAGSGYTTPLSPGINNLNFDVVYEGISWFADNAGGVGPGNTKFTSPDQAIISSPVAPTGNAAQSFCAVNNPTIADLAATGISIKWYSTITGGSALATSASLLNSTHYYASQTNVSGCESVSRLDVTVTINNVLTPAGAAAQSFCTVDNPTVSDLLATGTSIEWYTAPNGGIVLLPATVLINGSHYYASQTIAGCASATRLDVTVSISDPLAPTGAAMQSFCFINDPTVANLVASGTALQWYNVATGGIALPASSPLVNGSHYYASQTLSACESAGRLDVTVTINNPAAPTGNASQSFCSASDPTVTNLTATGTALQWYNTATGGSALSGTVGLINNTHYYASQIIGGCESAARLDVTVIMNNALVIVSQPVPTQNSCATFPVSFSVAATGDGLGLQWYKDGAALTDNSNISGSNTFTLNISQAGIADAGTYYIVINGISPCNSIQSNSSILNIAQEIIINDQPLSQTLCSGSSVVFSIDASGTGLTYQWRKGTTPLADGGRISGSTTASLTITNINSADAANDYNVLLSSPGGLCPQAISANVQLIVKALPDVTLTAVSPSICSGTPTAVLLTGSIAGTTFSWTMIQSGITGGSDGSGSNINQPLTTTGSIPGSIAYTITPLANGCNGLPVEIIIGVNPMPDVAATPASQTICSGTAPGILLTGTVSGTSFSWTVIQSGVSGATANSGSVIDQILTATGSIAGTATYTITPLANGCSGNQITVTVTVNPLVMMTADPATATICSGETTAVALSGNVTGSVFSWTVVQTNVSGASASGGSSIAQTLTATGSVAGTAVYTVTQSANGCDGIPVTVTITVNPTANINATPASQTICSGTTPSITLTSNVTGTGFSWTVVQTAVTGGTASGGSSIAQPLTSVGSVTGTAIYSVTPLAGGCMGNPVNITITVNPDVTISPLIQSICNGSSITPVVISGSVAGTITGWTRDNPVGITSSIALSGSGNIIGNFTNANANPVTISFTINAMSANGCVSSKTATVAVYSNVLAPVISASQIICTGSNASPLTSSLPSGGNSVYSYQWQQSAAAVGPWNAIAGATTNTYSPSAASQYYQLVVTNSCGTATSNVVQISTAFDFGVSFTGSNPSTSLCPESSFSYTLSSGSLLGSLSGGRFIRFSWQSQDPGYFTSATINPYGTTTSVLGIFTIYTGTASFTVHNNTNLPVTKNLLITPNIYNSNGSLYCSLSPEIIPVMINPVPVIFNYATAICSGTSFSILPTNNNPSASTIVPAATTYSWSAPVVTGGITGGSAQSAQSSISQTLSNPTNISQTATYTVTPIYSGSPSCAGVAFTIVVTVNPKPIIINQSATICNNGSFSIIPSATIVPAGTTYTWNAPVVTGAITGGVAATGQNSITGTLSNPTATIQTATYTVTSVSGAAGSCTGNSFTVNISVNPTTTGTLNSVLSTVCYGTGTTINFTGSANTIITYTINGGTNQTILLNVAGTASLPTGILTVNTIYALVSVSFAALPACTQALTGNVTVFVNPVATASVSINPVAVCQGQSATITFTGTANTIVTYNTGGPNQTITLNSSGIASLSGAVLSSTTYSLVGIAYPAAPNCNQALSALATVTVTSNVNAGIVSGLSPLCIGAAAAYSSNGDAAGTWSSSNTTVATVNALGIVTALSAGTSNISYTTSSGCNSPVSSFKYVTVSLNSNAGTISGTTPICVGANVGYAAIGADGGGAWSSSNTAVATVNNFGIVSGISAGTASIIYTVNAGCNAPVSSSQVISVESLGPTANAGAITGPAIVCASSAGFIYGINPVAGASFYVWTVPSGWAITAGSSTNSITVNSGLITGTITVKAGNVCGFSTASSLTVTVAAPGQWIGITTNWNDGQNWCSGILPGISTNVTIPSGTPNSPVISVATAMAHNVSIAAGASLTVTGAKFQIGGAIANNGSFDVTNGTIEMNGSLIQNIPANIFVNDALKNLIVSNSNAAGLTLNGRLDIYRSLGFGPAGLKLNTNGFLTLKSTAQETAWLEDMTGKNIMGDVTVERYIPDHFKAWQFLAIPVSGNQTVNEAWQDTATAPNQNRYPGYGTMLTGNMENAVTLGFDVYTPAGPSIKVFNSSSAVYDGIVNTRLLPVANAKGYMVLLRGDRSVVASNQAATATTLRTKGNLFTPSNPPVMINVGAGKFESVGNPYASAIDFSSVVKTGGVQTDFFYLWDPKLTSTINSAYGLGGFQTFSWNGSAFDVTPGGGSYTGLNRSIESGQAFFVHAPFSSGTVSFAENCKISGSNLVNRPTDILQPVQLRTNMFVVNGSNKILVDGNLLQYDASYFNTVDEQDAIKLGNNGENLGLLRNDKILSVERRALIQHTDTIFYNLGHLKVQQYEFEFIPANLEQQALTAFLEDGYLHTSTLINLRDTVRILFDIVNVPGSYASDRFRLVFLQSVPVPVTITGIQAKRNIDKTVTINWRVENETSMQLYTIERSADGINFYGIITADPILNNGSRAEYSRNDLSVLSGDNFYRIKAHSLSGLLQYSSIVKVAELKDSPAFSVYPNPVKGKIIQLHSINQPPGKYNMQLSNKSGQLIYQENFYVNNGSMVRTIFLKNNVAPGSYQLSVRAAGGTKWIKQIIIGDAP